MPEIIIIDTRNPQETKTLQLNPEDKLNQECLIGRDDRCCIVLQDNLASRTHGKIAFRHGNHFYCDLGSRNGSKINNEYVQVNQEYLLKPSDTITLGNHLLWVKAIAGQETEVDPQHLTPQQLMPLAGVDIASLETWTQGSKIVKCVQIIEETVDVKTFSFVCEPPVKFAYQPGQFLTLNLDINGKKIKRPYSISSTPSRPHTIEITVKRVPAPNHEPQAPSGLVSNWLHDNLQVGSQLEVNAPMGKFTNVTHPAAKILLISAGSGITPMMSMSRWICDTASQVDIVFLHSAPNPQDIIFRQELEMMSSRYANFNLGITLTRSVIGQPWYGYRGRINETILLAIAPDYQERNVYVCGSNSFMEATRELLTNLGFPLENYFEESFGGAKQPKTTTPSIPVPTNPVPTPINPAPPNPSPTNLTTAATNITTRPGDQTFIFSPPPTSAPTPTPTPTPTNSAPSNETVINPPSQGSSPSMPSTLIVSGSVPITSVTPVVSNGASSIIVLKKSGQEVVCDGEECILEAAEAEGANLPFGCRQGACGACKVRKISGEVIYDDDIACEDGFIYTCVARPLGKVVIEA